MARLELELDTRRFNANAKSAATQLGRVKGAAVRVQGAARNMGRTLRTAALAISAMAGAIGLFTRRSISALDAIGKQASKIGLAVEALQELQLAAVSSGVTIETFNMAFQRFTRRVAEARQGTGEAKGALTELGISLSDSHGRARDMEEVFRDVAEAMTRVGSQSDRVRLAMKLFDSEGVALVNMFQRGAGGLDLMRAKARSLGAVLSTELIDKSEKLETQIGTTSLAISQNLKAAVVEIGPILVKASEGALALAKALRGVASAVQGITDLGGLKYVQSLASGGAAESIEGTLGLGKRGGPPLTPRQAAQLYPGLGLEIGGTRSGAKRPSVIIPGVTNLGDYVPPIRPRMRAAVKEVTKDMKKLSTAAALVPPKVEEISEEMLKLEARGDRMGAAFEDAFTSMVDGTQSFADGIKAMARSVISELYRVLVVQQIVGGFDASTGTGSGLVGALMGGLGGLAGKRAAGGPVDAGRPYLVGERGPEVFVPAQAGAIQPNGGGWTIHQTLNIQTGVAQTVRTEMMAIAPQIAAAAKAAVADSVQRGGAYAAALR